MKKKYFSFIALILVFVMFLIAAGCGVRINGKEYEFYKSNQSEKKNSSIFDGIGQETADKQEFTQDKVEGEELKVKTNAGNVEIRKNDGSGIAINADKKVRGTSAEAKKTILENMIISLEQSGDKLEVVVKTKDGEDFWDWQKENYKTYQITINYTIKVPEGIKSLNISTGAGNVNMESLAEKVKTSTGAGNIDINEMNAQFDLSTGAGNIDIDNSSAKGDCKLSIGAGNVDFEGNIDAVDEFDASTGMGNLDFNVPEETKMTLEASTGVGILSGSFVKTNEDSKFRFKGDINGGGPTVKLSTGVGNVVVDKN
ncbi:hypothetical protein CLHUN_38740 [Ruminiclostridium hungatei]|uniref:Adhesin domain-containing protein n=1 Tax=Ruminiclostridium hungatei TaxID=48256 RepID=A0A1V4SEH5_RUMHU|nr:DUF4097 family beta strand repeat-containing protein [Ruminiclostridium hungatei]OPX42224.1 hypothetical protein CLHUN_38740 [Ruminiclostridium hungatei]